MGGSWGGHGGVVGDRGGEVGGGSYVTYYSYSLRLYFLYTKNLF